MRRGIFLFTIPSFPPPKRALSSLIWYLFSSRKTRHAFLASNPHPPTCFHVLMRHIRALSLVPFCRTLRDPYRVRSRRWLLSFSSTTQPRCCASRSSRKTIGWCWCCAPCRIYMGCSSHALRSTHSSENRVLRGAGASRVGTCSACSCRRCGALGGEDQDGRRGRSERRAGGGRTRSIL